MTGLVIPAEVPEAVIDAVAEAIGGSAYDCTRCWSAWHVGTMSAQDFHGVADDGDRVAEIALATITAWEASKPKQAPAADPDEYMLDDVREPADRLLALIDGSTVGEANPRAQWNAAKPTIPGAYWVRGWSLGAPSLQALVEVRECEEEGELLCNLHGGNSNEFAFEPLVDYSDDFEWLGPLEVQP